MHENCGKFAASQIYTVSQKTIHVTFDHSFSNRRPIFNIVSLTDSKGNSV